MTASPMPGPQGAAAAMLFAAGTAGFRLLRRACRRQRCGHPLRHCPLCASAAVGVLEYEIVGEQVRVLQQCGQCGVWRENVAPPSAVARHERMLEADRTQILRCMGRLARGLSEAEPGSVRAPAPPKAPVDRGANRKGSSGPARRR
jgi:hypothetical protein